MRRAAPWLLLGLLVVGAGAGAGAGVAMQNPVLPSLEHILATTRAAGSARFGFRSVVESANRSLRSASNGSGLVDFTSGDLSLSTTVRELTSASTGEQPPTPELQVVTTREVDLPGVRYLSVEPVAPSPAGRTDIASPWQRVRIPRRDETLGLLGVLTRGTDYGLFPDPVELSERSIGTRRIDGSSATGYAFSPVAGCRLLGPADVPHQRLGALVVWVDALGRMVRAQSTVSLVVPPGSGPAPEQRSQTATKTSTLSLGDFGVAARIVAPPPERGVFAGSVSVGIAVLKSPSC